VSTRAIIRAQNANAPTRLAQCTAREKRSRVRLLVSSCSITPALEWISLGQMARNFTRKFAAPSRRRGVNHKDNAASSATEVLIASYPKALGTISDLVVTDWSDQVSNFFRETKLKGPLRWQISRPTTASPSKNNSEL
jgi:hypothetical protein